MRKKIVRLCSAAALTVGLLCGSCQFAAFADSFPCVGVVVASNVNVRTGAGTDHEVISQTGYGVLLDVYAREGNWFKIGIGGGATAYISADYVSLRNEDVQTARNGSGGGGRAVELAKRYLGTPYVYGGSSPSGFDCSGFTSYIYRQLGYSINRTADAQLANGVPVSKENLRPGDLVMFKRAGSSSVHHVGIYAGNGQMIHSPNTGNVVRYESITSGYYNNCYYAARRIIQ